MNDMFASRPCIQFTEMVWATLMYIRKRTRLTVNQNRKVHHKQPNRVYIFENSPLEFRIFMTMYEIVFEFGK